MLTGHALLTTFKSDLKLTKEENNWATSAFFIAYVSLFLLLTSSPQNFTFVFADTILMKLSELTYK